MSVYIHIPFCKTICDYCDFCKYYYNKKWISSYLDTLELEILKYYKNDLIETIYIGGGTPNSLDIEDLNRLFLIIKKLNTNILEFTIECNLDVTEEQLILFKNNGVNRISIGIQTINEHLLKKMGRFHTRSEVINKINLIKKYFNNINIDLMYALPSETIEDLNNDLDFYLSLDVSHISTYSLMIEPNTKMYINGVKNIDEELDFKMYNLILKKLIDNGYEHYEISNYCKKGYESKHNLVYWNNEEYYGFGISASGYVNNIRYTNTKSYNNYLKDDYRIEEINLTINEKIENEFILGLRKIKGIDIFKFKEKYNLDIFNIDIVKNLLNERKLELNDNYLRIPDKYIYISNNILCEFMGFDYSKLCNK